MKRDNNNRTVFPVAKRVMVTVMIVIFILSCSLIAQGVNILRTVGDVNGDGDVTVTDFVQIKNHLLQNQLLSGSSTAAADLNGDGAITITDFLQMKTLLLNPEAVQAAKNAYTEYLVENVGAVTEYMVYDADGRFVALHNGAAVGVYETQEEALTAMIGAEFDASKLADSGDGKLFIYGGEVTTPDGGDEEDTLVEKPFFSTVLTQDLASAPSAPDRNNPVSYKPAINSLLEGKRVTKIGIPVKSVDDHTADCSMEIYLTTSTQPVQTIQTYTLTIPANTYASNTVNAWYYFDVDITIGTGQMLAFGSRDKDTLVYAYNSVFKEAVGCDLNVDTNQGKTASSACLLFDIYYDAGSGEGETGPTEKALFSTVLQQTGWKDAAKSNNPVSYREDINEKLVGKRITKIGVAVTKVDDYTKDSTMEICLTSSTKPVTVIETVILTIPANTFSSNTVNGWYYFDVDITVGTGQMLAFGSTTDSITFAWNEALSETAGCYLKVKTEANRQHNARLLFDIYYENPLEGKYISFMGASTSTYAGYSNNTIFNSNLSNNGSATYPANNVQSVNDTWWMKTINGLDMKLCVNNSWSGSCVTTTIDGTQKAGCMDRATQLHNDNYDIEPDIIVLVIGGNDALRKYTIGTYNGVSDIYDGQNYIGDTTLFGQAYATMVHKVQVRYPDADIYVCSMLPWPKGLNSGADLEAYNDMVKKIADEFGVTYVDFYNNADLPADVFYDTVHPTKAGFAEMANCMIETLIEKYMD